MNQIIFECAEGKAYRTDSGRIGISCNSEFPPAMALEIERLQEEVGVLKKKNATSLANNLCPDHRDKQAGKPCLACTIETRTRQHDTMIARCTEAESKFSAQVTANQLLLEKVAELEGRVVKWREGGARGAPNKQRINFGESYVIIREQSFYPVETLPGFKVVQEWGSITHFVPLSDFPLPTPT